MPRKPVAKAKKKAKKVYNKVMLVDADILMYRLCTATEFMTVHENEDKEVWETLNGQDVLDRAEGDIEQWKTILHCDDVLLLFSSSENYRKRLNPLYKANRRDKRKPLGYAKVCAWISELYTALTMAPYEADDLLGIYATGAKELLGGRKSVIVTADKDLKTIPGEHYNPWIDDNAIVTIDDEAAFKFLITQCIAGDTTDGYKGVAGVGPKGAVKFAHDAWDMGHRTIEECFQSHIVPIYKEKGHDIFEAKLNCQMAEILTRKRIKINKDGTWTRKVVFDIDR